jgi:hypothetical protein
LTGIQCLSIQHRKEGGAFSDALTVKISGGSDITLQKETTVYGMEPSDIASQKAV